MPGSKVDDAVGSGYGLAAFHLQNSILRALFAKGIFTLDDVSTTVDRALEELQATEPEPSARELKALGVRALTILSHGWEIPPGVRL